MYLNEEQYKYLLNPLKSTRVATRKQGGKNLSYLEAWDVKAHLTRIFGFGNWDSEVLTAEHVGNHEYLGGDNNDREMVEVMWHVALRLTIHTQQDGWPRETTVYCESAVGSATGRRDRSGLGDLHDNAVKQAASDALKRCAINLGTQFGLSLYNDGQRTDVVRQTLITPPGYTPPEKPSQEAEQALAKSVGTGDQTPTAEGESS